MKLDCTLKTEVIGKSKDVSKDGRTTYYRLTLMQDPEAGKLSCSEEIYDMVQKGSTYTFKAQFNDEYKSFRLIDIVDMPERQKVSADKK